MDSGVVLACVGELARLLNAGEAGTWPSERNHMSHRKTNFRSARRLAALGLIGATFVAGSVLAGASPASASGVYVCYSYTPVNYPNGNPATYYPFPDGVQGDRCSSQNGGGGAGLDLPINP